MLESIISVAGYIGKGFAVLVCAVSFQHVCIVDKPVENPLAGYEAGADFRSSLAFEITNSATSMTLVSTSTPSGENLIMGRVYGFKIGGSEYVKGTLSAGKQITSMTRGISLLNGTTTGGVAARWGRGTAVELTDAPLILEHANKINGRENFDNVLVYASGVSSATGTKQHTDAVFVEGFAQTASTSAYLTASSTIYGGNGTFVGANIFSGANTFTATTTFNKGILGVAAYDCVTSSAATEYCQKGYIDSVAIAGASNGSLTAKGIFEEATNAETNAGTLTGATGAHLVLTPEAFANSTWASSSPAGFSTTTTVNLATTTVTSAFFPTKTHLEIDIVASSSADAYAKIILNGDSGANYATKFTVDGGVASTYSSEKFIPLGDSGNGAGGTMYAHIEIFNPSSAQKYGTYKVYTGAQGTPTAGSIREGVFTYKSNSQITQLDMYYHTAGSLVSTTTQFRIVGY